jgi:hypothetical protein
MSNRGISRANATTDDDLERLVLAPSPRSQVVRERSRRGIKELVRKQAKERTAATTKSRKTKRRSWLNRICRGKDNVQLGIVTAISFEERACPTIRNAGNTAGAR